MTRKVEITMMNDGQLSIDGQCKPAGDIHIEEYVDNDLVGGCYATYENLVEKLKDFFKEEQNDPNGLPMNFTNKYHTEGS